MTNFDLKTLGLADGTHKITVVAKADGYLPSPPSNAVSYVVGVQTLKAGLYDANNTLIASWDSLVNYYGMNCQIDYSAGSDDNHYKTTVTSPYYVLTNNSELANGVKLIIGNDTIRIGVCAFYSCSSLTSIIIPDSVTSIGSWAFRYCSKLTSITIGNGVTSIGTRAFGRCLSLTSITIPNSVTSINYKAFEDCSSLEYIYCEAESKPSGWDSDWNSGCDAEVIWGYKPLITFTINGTSYQAENGMTWAEWVDSEYCPTNYDYYVANNKINRTNYMVDDVLATDTIISGKAYTETFYGSAD